MTKTQVAYVCESCVNGTAIDQLLARLQSEPEGIRLCARCAQSLLLHLEGMIFHPDVPLKAPDAFTSGPCE